MVALDLEVDPAELRVPCSADVLHRLAEQVHAGQEIHDVSGFGVVVAENGHVRGFKRRVRGAGRGPRRAQRALTAG
jgi:hypothetical protein